MNWHNVISEGTLVYSSNASNRKLRTCVVNHEHCAISLYEEYELSDFEYVLLSLLIEDSRNVVESILHVLGANLSDHGERQIFDSLINDAQKWGLVKYDGRVVEITSLGAHCLRTNKKYKFFTGRADIFEHLSINDPSADSPLFDFYHQIGLQSSIFKGEEIGYDEINPDAVFCKIDDPLITRLHLQTQSPARIYTAKENGDWLPEPVQVNFKLFLHNGKYRVLVFNGNNLSENATDLLSLKCNSTIHDAKVEWCLYERLLTDDSVQIDFDTLSPFADLLGPDELYRLISSGRIVWDDHKLFSLLAGYADADNWSTISQYATPSVIIKELDAFIENWDWIYLSQRLPCSFIVGTVGSYPWHYDIVAVRDDIVIDELEGLLLSPLVDHYEWDWSAILAKVDLAFVESNLDRVDFDLFEVTERIANEKPELIIGHPSRQWDWIKLSSILPVELIAENYVDLLPYVNIRLTLLRIFDSTDDLASKVYSSQEVGNYFDSIDQARIGFNFNLEKLNWSKEIIGFLLRYGIVSWHSDLVKGLECNPHIIWDKELFQMYGNEIVSQEGFDIVSSNVVSPSSVLGNIGYPWNWKILSANPNLICDQGFVTSCFSHFDAEVLLRNAPENILEGLLEQDTIINDIPAGLWATISDVVPISFLVGHPRAPYLWDWKVLTRRTFDKIKPEKIGDPKWIHKWDWSYLTEHLDWSFVNENLETFANRWDWSIMVDRIPEEALMDPEMLKRVGLCLLVIGQDIQSNFWASFTKRYNLQQLLEIIPATERDIVIKWDYSQVYNDPGFNALKHLQSGSKIHDWPAFSASSSAASIFKFDDKLLSRKVWRDTVVSELNNQSHKWDFKKLSHQQDLINDFPLLDIFSEMWDWRIVSEQSRVFEGKAAEKSIKKFSDLVDYEVLSSREGMDVSSQTLLPLAHKPWDWKVLSSNPSFHLDSLDVLEELKDHRLDWGALSGRADIDFSGFEYSSIIDREWNWSEISNRKDIVFTEEAIRKLYVYPLDWEMVSRRQDFEPTPTSLSLLKPQKLDWGAISSNEHLDKSVIWDNRDRLNWYRLTRNTQASNLSDIEYLAKYEDYLDWGYVTLHLDKSFFVHDNILRFKDKLDWSRVTEYIPHFTPDILEEFKDKLDWTLVSSNETIAFTSSLIQRFRKYWDWAELQSNRAANKAMTIDKSSFAKEWNVARFINRFRAVDSHLSPKIYHFTHLFNAVEIIRSRKILSRNKALLSGSFADAAGSVVSRIGRAHPYARFYFRPKTPTQFYNEFLGLNSSNFRYYERARRMGLPKCPFPVFFEFNLQEVLAKMPERCYYSTGNMQADSSRIYGVQEIPDKLNVANLYLQSSARNSDLYMMYSQQEFLVKEEFDFSEIHSFRIICFDKEQASLLKSLIGNDSIADRIEVDPSIYNNNNSRVDLHDTSSYVSISTDYADQAYFEVTSASLSDLIIENPQLIIKEGHGSICFRDKVSIKKNGTDFEVHFIDPLARTKDWLVYSTKS